ncbi:hypothetical protein K7432_009870 [Basidiobolus ranarum]|uniref:Carrier domain-containing protein n=1 Tax=Basidiobolus ranarum TaxID=34480 RepID=A0ABR2VWE4_9FUNG
MAESKSIYKNLAILGAGRSGTCLLVELAQGQDEKKSRQLTLGLVQTINRQIPKHSRIRKNMIYILPPDKTLPCTPKGNISRKKITIEYAQEIDDLYKQTDDRSENPQQIDMDERSIQAYLQETIARILDLPSEKFADHSKSLIDMGMDSIAAMEFHSRISSQIPDVNLPFSSVFDHASIDALGSHIFNTAKKRILDHDNICQFLQTSIANILEMMPVHFQDFNASLIELGMDSIAAMQFRNAISKRFSFLDLPFSFVFEHPTIHCLSQFLIQQAGDDRCPNGTEEDLVDLDEYFERFVDKYTIKDIALPQKQAANEPEGISILMTGGSGYLGVHVINELLTNNKIHHIYCLIRGNSEESCYRKLVNSFENVNLSTQALLANKVKLTVYPCDLNDEHFGLNTETYEYLGNNVTHIYHGAWRMDFNSNLEAFEPTCLVPTLNLAKFAISESGLKRYIFISSIGACGADTRPLIPETPHPANIRIAMPNGYGRSKLVAEEALVRMGKQGLPVTIVRYGQISGNSETGAWNTREQFPILIRNAINTGLSPIVTMPTDWIPVNIGARSLGELITYPKDQQESINVYHQVNPHPTLEWTKFIEFISYSSGRAIQLLPLKEWWTNLLQLAQSNDTLRREDPITALLPYLEKMAHSEIRPTSIKLDTKLTCRKSRTLAKNCPIIDEILLSSYIQYWKQTGFLTI